MSPRKFITLTQQQWHFTVPGAAQEAEARAQVVQEEVVGALLLVDSGVEEDLEEDLVLEALAQEDEADSEVEEGNQFLTVKD